LTLIYKVEDSNDKGDVNIGIFLVGSSETEPTVSDLDPFGTGVPDSLRNFRTIADSLSVDGQVFNFEGFDRDPVTNEIVTESSPYKVYLGVIDGTGRRPSTRLWKTRSRDQLRT
jgi:hypothetical protein